MSIAAHSGLPQQLGPKQLGHEGETGFWAIGPSEGQGKTTVVFSDVYRSDPSERIGWIRAGIPARTVKQLADVMDMPQTVFNRSLGLSTATVNRKKSADSRLSPDDSERVIAMAKLIGQVQTMVAESSEIKDFDAAKWLGEWLEAPLEALGGQQPATFLDTAEGRELIGDMLLRMQSGAYS